MANVRDLLIRMSLNTEDFKTNIADAKRELKNLKSEYNAISSDSTLENAGAKQVANLREQKSAAEALVKEYQKGIGEIQAKLNSVPQGSQAATEMQKQITNLETAMNNAQTQVNNLQTEIDSITLDNLVSKAESAASIFANLRMGFGGLLDGVGETADSADEVYVARQAAFTSATKNVEDERQTKEDLDALNASLREMSTRIPQTYEQLSALMGIGATLGVPYEYLLQFTEIMAKLNVATNVEGEAGAQAMAQFLNITEKGYDNLDRLGAVLTELGNNSATTEQNILEMAHRASTGLSTVGMSAQDILAVSAALNSVGIEAQAGGSSVSKLGITMDKAANVGAQSIQKLLDAAPGGWGAFDSIYELYAFLDSQPSSQGWKAFEAALGMTATDTKALMNSALAAERFSAAMGQTVEEFSSGWNEDSANQMLNFFRALGEMDGTDESENMLWVMDQLGIKEVRQSNMVRALANNWELYANMLGLARDAYDENIALENEANRAFGTNESRRVLNQNKEQNALEAMGQTVTAMRKPWEDFFGDLKQWYADWPGWAQTAVAGAAESMKIADTVLEKMGDISLSVLAITKAIQELEGTSIGAALIKKLGGAAAAGSAAATLAPYALLTGGTLALGAALDKSSTERNWGQFNRDVEQADQLLAEASDERVTRLQGIFGAFTQAMQDFEDDNVDPDYDRAESLKNTFRQYANELLQEMPELDFWEKVKDLVNLEDGLDQDEIEQIVNSMEFADQWLSLGNEAVTSLAQGIRDREAELLQQVTDMGAQIPAGLAQGIYDNGNEAIEAAQWLADAVQDTVQGGLDINSPSRVARVLGAYFSEGFALGIEDGVSRVESAADRVAKAVTSSARGRGSGGNGAGNANFILNIDGRRLAQAVAPLIDEALGEVDWV